MNAVDQGRVGVGMPGEGRIERERDADAESAPRRTWRSPGWSGAAAILAVMGLSPGCSKPKMPVPAELAAVSDELPVTGRSRFGSMPGVGESFRIGAYEVTDVDRDAQFSVGSSFPLFSHTDVIGGYSYRFRGTHDERRAECAFEADKKVFGHGAPVAVRKAKGRLGCVCRGSENESGLTVHLSYTRPLHSQEGVWVLGTGASVAKEDVGELQAGGRDFGIRVTSRAETKGTTWVVGEAPKEGAIDLPLGEPTGCLVYGEGPEAGLELLHPGRVWLARSLTSSEREDMACLLSGLLLYRVATDWSPR